MKQFGSMLSFVIEATPKLRRLIFGCLYSDHTISHECSLPRWFFLRGSCVEDFTTGENWRRKGVFSNRHRLDWV